MSELLAIEHLTAGYGEATVLTDISLSVGEGESLALLGRNGMGKTTLLKSLMGLVPIKTGTIEFDGKAIQAATPYERARAGIGWVAQEREIFPTLSVEENLTVAARPGRWDLNAIFDLFPRIQERRKNMGNQLSGGEQQMLAVARALMTNPALLLLDEPTEGLAPIIVEELTRSFRRMIAEEGTAVILVEQHAEIALSLTDNAVVLERGAIVHDAASAALKADPAVLERFLGVSGTAH